MDKINVKVETIFDSIYRKSRSHYLAQLHGTMGFVNTEDVIADIIHRYETETVPSIMKLSDEDKKLLLEKLNSMLASEIPGYTKDFFKTSIEYIKMELNPKKEEIEEPVIIEKLDSVEEEMVNGYFDSLCELNQNYCETRYHSTFGINVGDILDDMVNKYTDEILPSIKELSVPARTVLQTKLKDKIDNIKPEDKMDTNILKRFINDIESSKINQATK